MLQKPGLCSSKVRSGRSVSVVRRVSFLGVRAPHPEHFPPLLLFHFLNRDSNEESFWSKYAWAGGASAAGLGLVGSTCLIAQAEATAQTPATSSTGSSQVLNLGALALDCKLIANALREKRYGSSEQECAIASVSHVRPSHLMSTKRLPWALLPQTEQNTHCKSGAQSRISRPMKILLAHGQEPRLEAEYGVHLCVMPWLFYPWPWLTGCSGLVQAPSRGAWPAQEHYTVPV